MTTATLRSWTPRSVDVQPVDQARGLRALLERREQTLQPGVAQRCTTIAITSGKGGVGKSVIAVNLAVALSQQGLRVCLFDANLGVGNIDLLCGLSSYWNLSHVVTGARRLPDVCLQHTNSMHIIPGASGLAEVRDCPTEVQQLLLQQLRQLESQYDVLLIDTGSGSHQLARQLAETADHVLVITTPEPTSIADAYATVKSLHAVDGPSLSVVVNQATTAQSEQILERIQATSRRFLGSSLALGVGIPFDAAVPHAVRRRQPLLELSPNSEASRAVYALSDRITAHPMTMQSTGYFCRLWSRLLPGTDW